eukprot:scaffold664_cov260-Pinguiococcus_pyrenoidosus.AAC.7
MLVTYLSPPRLVFPHLLLLLFSSPSKQPSLSRLKLRAVLRERRGLRLFLWRRRCGIQRLREGRSRMMGGSCRRRVIPPTLASVQCQDSGCELSGSIEAKTSTEPNQCYDFSIGVPPSLAPTVWSQAPTNVESSAPTSSPTLFGTTRSPTVVESSAPSAAPTRRRSENADPAEDDGGVDRAVFLMVVGVIMGGVTLAIVCIGAISYNRQKPVEDYLVIVPPNVVAAIDDRRFDYNVA